MLGGFYQLDRILWERLGRELKPLQRLLVVQLMVSVHFKNGRVPVVVPGDCRRTLKPGERVTSCGCLADELDLSERTVRRMLAVLVDRWAWLTVVVKPGRAGSAGVYVLIDIDAAKAWATDDRTESPVSPVIDRTESPVSAGPDRESGLDRTMSPVSTTQDRTESPKDVEPAVESIQNKQARRVCNVSPGQSRARARSTDDNGPHEWERLTANDERHNGAGPEYDLWCEITRSWPCHGVEGATARSEACALFDGQPLRALAIARGLQRQMREGLDVRRPWLVFESRTQPGAYSPGDGDGQWVKQRLQGDRSRRIVSIADALDSGLAQVAGSRERAVMPRASPPREPFT